MAGAVKEGQALVEGTGWAALEEADSERERGSVKRQGLDWEVKEQAPTVGEERAEAEAVMAMAAAEVVVAEC